MSLLQQAPRFSSADAIRLARDHYGLGAEASPLPSERDQNFLLTTASGVRFVLKIANATEARAGLEAQNAAMARVAARSGRAPRVIPTLAGESIVSTDGPHLVRLVTYLPGIPLAEQRERTPGLLEDLGRAVAEVDAALADWDDPAIHRDFHWDLANASRAIPQHLPLVRDERLRRLVRELSARAGRIVEARQPWLRRGAIHNDANDWNVLVTGGRVSGLIDFGDMVASWTVADLAVAIAYAVLDAPDPLSVAAPIARGYHRGFPLRDEEIAALFPLVCLRLCLSVCIAAWQQRQRPDDEYLGVSQGPIGRTLPALGAIDEVRAENVLREACGLEPRLPADQIAAARTRLIGGNLSVGYRQPVHLVRGWMQYLFDADGRRYIDGYNNVPHVGHCHPAIVEAAERQMRTLNTNTRYLHESLERYAERLTSTLPPPLRVCYFVNSGSEANELALRLARTHTRQRDLIVLDAAYHGNTTTLIDISPYKFNGPGGSGKPAWVHVAPVPDVYRGAHKADDSRAGEKYAEAVDRILGALRARGTGVCGYIAESCPSVAGQIMLPPGYLAAVYRLVRDAGGVCIADEVQTAYGRIGTHFYGFQQQDVVPDIVVLGKPIGNGHPIGAVVTTAEIASSFANGMEFFSTFGGNTVSCVIGTAVLDVLRDEGLQAHASRVGSRLIGKLRPLVGAHPLVGDVRGSGLFVGVELVRDRETLEPATREASDVANRLRERGILIGTDGPFHNVLKVRPPMPFSDADADALVSALDAAL
jgi:4-aminobutyrate aminotransferase-like enzyme